MEKQMPTTGEELTEFVKDYLKENLSISVNKELRFGGHSDIDVEIRLNGDTISSNYFTIYND